MSISKRMKVGRETAFPGLSIRTVANHIGVHGSTISQIEAGGTPRADALPLYTEAYGCDCNWLVTGVGRKPRKAKVSQ